MIGLHRYSALGLYALLGFCIAGCADANSPTEPVALALRTTSSTLVASSGAERLAEQKFEQVSVTFVQTNGCITRAANLVPIRSTGTEPSQVASVFVNFVDFDDCANHATVSASAALPIDVLDIPENVDLIRVVAHGDVVMTSDEGTRTVPVIVDVTIRLSEWLVSTRLGRGHQTCTTAIDGLMVPCERMGLARGSGFERTPRHPDTRNSAEVTGTMSLDGVNYAVLPINDFQASWERNVCVVPRNIPNDTYGRPCGLFEPVI